MSADHETNDRGSDEVLELLRRYTDAVYRADVAALRACFHLEAVMSGLLGDSLLMGSPEPFFTDIGSRPSMESTGAPYEPTIVSVEVLGRVASVRLDETGFFGSWSFANWFHLLRGEDAAWRITSKTFAMLEV